MVSSMPIKNLIGIEWLKNIHVTSNVLMFNAVMRWMGVMWHNRSTKCRMLWLKTHVKWTWKRAFMACRILCESLWCITIGPFWWKLTLKSAKAEMLKGWRHTTDWIYLQNFLRSSEFLMNLMVFAWGHFSCVWLTHFWSWQEQGRINICIFFISTCKKAADLGNIFM